MATFRAYAKVLKPDDPTMRIYEAGLRACPGEPGMPLAEVLRRSGGVYQTTTPLIPHMRDDIREVAELTSDAELLKISELTEVPVSLEHLRGLDPQTRVIIRSELSFQGDEASQVSAATRPRHALATVMPDGTVIPGDVRPLGRSRSGWRGSLLRFVRVGGNQASVRCRSSLSPARPGHSVLHVMHG